MTELTWDRPEPAPRSTPTPLSRDAIVRAALAQADAAGLEAVSLRKVAAALDVGPMRLYRYVATKDELLERLEDAALAEAGPAPATGGWRGALRAHAAGTWAAAQDHPWLADLLGRRPALGPAALARLDAVLTPLVAVAGVEAATRATDVVEAYTLGAIRRAAAERQAERDSGADKAVWQELIGPYLARVLDDGKHPGLAAMVADAPSAGPEAAFAEGLEILLDGVAARVEGR